MSSAGRCTRPGAKPAGLQSVPGYALQASESLAPPAWQNVTNVAVPTSDGMTVTDSPRQPSKFYRLNRQPD